VTCLYHFDANIKYHLFELEHKMNLKNILISAPNEGGALSSYFALY
jgi:hypothetical protein